jgi:hypothetical protein
MVAEDHIHGCRVGGASLSGALFSEDISSIEGQLFPQQSMLVHE